ncbi:major tail protein [Falseniella ignava]|uniref:Phi13 family phage major tail protein n=1 Tax=Falseniella ignava CCUG 37419 TaxID=883112 RepID=K1LG32_9LACT|nr:major tail protein [Falseniella ignava]EKB53581.1 phi13 family phage major tail protein [Falseniella ignava CCUG 37419]
MKNKVKFNVCNVHYSLITKTDEGYNFGIPVPMPGAVSISLNPNGEPESFYADGIEYYTISNNMGYDGDFEVALIPESFRIDVLKESVDANQVLVENANSETANFALLFEFDGDKHKIRHVMYNCSAARPGIEGKTNEESREVQPETLTISARPLANGFVKARTGNETTQETYDTWYKNVYLPVESTVVTPPEGTGV